MVFLIEFGGVSLLPKKEIDDIKMKINEGSITKPEYEAVVLRLIDTIRQKDEEINKLNREIGHFAGIVGKMANQMVDLSTDLQYESTKICMTDD